MEHMGVRGVALNIFKDYLSGRSQCVKIDSIFSDEEFIGFGIPQGSILGPTLFQIYINDLCQLSLTQCDIFTYADDTALLLYDKSWDQVKHRTELTIRTVMKWLSTNLLTLNLSKTKVIQFLPPNSPLPPPDSIKLRAHICHDAMLCKCSYLTMVSSIKYLGVHIDEKLDWRVHTDTLCSRLRKLMYLFKELRHAADLETATLVYRSLCESIITYCIPVWGGTFKTVMLRVERAQRAVLKVMHFRRRDYPTAQLYSDAQVLTVRKLYVLRSVLRRHSMMPLDRNLTSRRIGFPVCESVQCRSALARRHYCAQSSLIYNKINKKLAIYKLNIHKVKQSLKSWLISLSYEDTEQILEVLL
ncbi:hypothetical protein PYW07_002997 [Mythimna separata]|uniref:Reverse transcriptase domain-containing protein n=1 Tax=Mythimna separata TaxID=271217 RepID=A0AAD8DPY7_MYTSE|nr:hypothetical protein PYW07_002997 [Mythimna separata]